MRHIMLVWAKSRDSLFEANVPLVFLGERNRRLGSQVRFEVLFLEGLRFISEEYRQRLSVLGFILHDAEDLYQSLKKKYVALARFGDYEQKCFLRWLVIRELYGGAPFAHYDADIVFNATPDEIEIAFRGLTLTVQGCPAYVRADSSAWLEGYKAELDRFVASIEAYSAAAWRQRELFVTTYQERNGSLWGRRIISSDQDLVQFLTLSGRLPQADAATVRGRCSGVLFKNPISIGEDTHLPLPLRYERLNGIDYLNGQKVAFWHLQNDFCNYLGYASFRKQMLLGGRVPWQREAQTLSYLSYRAARKLSSSYTRGQLARRYFDSHEDLGFLLNNESFWQRGVFL